MSWRIIERGNGAGGEKQAATKTKSAAKYMATMAEKAKSGAKSVAASAKSKS